MWRFRNQLSRAFNNFTSSDKAFQHLTLLTVTIVSSYVTMLWPSAFSPFYSAPDRLFCLTISVNQKLQQPTSWADTRFETADDSLWHCSNRTVKKRGVSFFVFLQCRIHCIYTTKSRFEVVRYSEKWLHLLLLIWMDGNWSLFLIYKSCPVTYKSCQRESKINYYSWFSSRGTSRLIKWIYKERYELRLLKIKQQLNNSL